MSTLPPEDPQNAGATPPPPPPPPPGSGYGSYGESYGGASGGGAPPPAGPAAGGWSVGDALSWGWAKFQANVGQIIIAALILLVAVVVAEGIGFVIRLALVHPGKCTVDSGAGYSMHCTSGSGFIVSLLASAIMSFLFFVGAQIIGAMIIRGALDVSEGRPFEVAGLFNRLDIGKVVITSLITGAIVFVGSLLCYLPGLIAAFVLSYSLYFVVDRGLEPMEAIKASFNLVKDHLGDTILWFIVGALVAAVGFCLCLVGALVSVPVVVLGTAYTYKKLTGQAVAA